MQTEFRRASRACSLTVEDAVQIVLFNNRGLQAMYGELGIAEADLVQADTCRATLPIAPTGIKMEVDSRSRSERDICDATTVKLLLVKIES